MVAPVDTAKAGHRGHAVGARSAPRRGGGSCDRRHIWDEHSRAFDLTAGFSAWQDIDAFQFFYLVLPLFRGSYEATGVFYFDFVRLRRIPALREFRLSFFYKLLWTTPVITLFFWALGVVLGLFVLPDVPFSFLLALLPLFVVRSLIGAYQIRLFAEGQFRALNTTIVFSAGLFALVWIDVNPASDLVELTAAMIVLLIVHINLQHLQDRATPLPTLLSLGDWIHTLAQEPGAVRVGTIVIPDWIPARQKSAAVKLTQQTFDGAGYFAFRSSTTLVFYERASNGENEQRPHLTLQAITGGATNRGGMLPGPSANGRDALDRLIAAQWLQPIEDVSAVPGSPEALKSEFSKLFPDGVVLDLQTGEGTRDMRDLKQGVLAAILPAAVKSSEEGASVVPVSGRWLSAVSYCGKLRLLFILSPEFDRERLRRWRRTLTAWHTGSSTTEGVSHVGAG